MAGDTLIRNSQHISYFKLIPGRHGEFDIRFDGELVAEHRHKPGLHIFPDLQDLVNSIDQMIK